MIIYLLIMAGVKRWPYRTLKSLDKSIDAFQSRVAATADHPVVVGGLQKLIDMRTTVQGEEDGEQNRSTVAPKTQVNTPSFQPPSHSVEQQVAQLPLFSPVPTAPYHSAPVKQELPLMPPPALPRFPSAELMRSQVHAVRGNDETSHLIRRFLQFGASHSLC